MAEGRPAYDRSSAPPHPAGGTALRALRAALRCAWRALVFSFFAVWGILGGTYVVLLVGLIAADVAYMASSDTEQLVLPEWVAPHRAALRPVLPLIAALADSKIQYSIKLTLVSCAITAVLSLIVAIPIGYVLSRFRFFGRNLIDSILDVPIVLPPLVVGLSLLILFQFWPFALIRSEVVYQVPAVIIAQFMVAAAFAVRTMRSTFDQIDTRREDVAMTLGCSRVGAFLRVALPEARTGMLTAGTLAWARALGEFGPLLVFAGTTRRKTEVLSSTVYLEINVGNLPGAVAVSLLMVMCAVAVLVVARVWGTRSLSL